MPDNRLLRSFKSLLNHARANPATYVGVACCTLILLYVAVKIPAYMKATSQQHEWELGDEARRRISRASTGPVLGKKKAIVKEFDCEVNWLLNANSAWFTVVIPVEAMPQAPEVFGKAFASFSPSIVQRPEDYASEQIRSIILQKRMPEEDLVGVFECFNTRTVQNHSKASELSVSFIFEPRDVKDLTAARPSTATAKADPPIESLTPEQRKRREAQTWLRKNEGSKEVSKKVRLAGIAVALDRRFGHGVWYMTTLVFPKSIQKEEVRTVAEEYWQTMRDQQLPAWQDEMKKCIDQSLQGFSEGHGSGRFEDYPWTVSCMFNADPVSFDGPCLTFRFETPLLEK